MENNGQTVIVVDTNILAYFWFPSEFSFLAEKAIQKDSEWIAPLLWRSEFLSFLAGLMRNGRIDYESALQILQQVERQMSGHEYTVHSDRTLELIHKSSCSAYDCEFIALAQDLEIPLLTQDQQILTAFPRLAVSLSQFCA